MSVKTLFIETGLKGGGSYASLDLLLRNLSSDIRPVVVHSNKTPWLDRLYERHIPAYHLWDMAYSIKTPATLRKRAEKYSNKGWHRYKFGRSLARAIHGPFIRNLKKIIQDNDIDVIYCNDQCNRDVYGGFLAEETGLPLISHLRSLDGNSYYGSKMEFMNDAVTAFIANSPTTKEYWISKGVPAAKMHLVYNAAEFYDGPASDLKIDFGIPDTHQVICSVGRMVRFKRQALLAEAFKKVRQQLPDTTLLFVGSGPEETALRDKCKNIPNVVFAGWREDGAAITKACDVSILLSPKESFGRVIIEAMAVETPVIGVASGGIIDIIDDPKNGRLVPVDDVNATAQALIDTLTSDKIEEQIKQAVLDVKEKFSPDKTSHEIEAIIKNIAIGHS